MRSRKILAAVACVGSMLAACGRPVDDGATGGGGRGRYAGAGVYPAGRMWSQIAGVGASKEAMAARLGDDEQVIVVVDSHTGELRQCGNLSGYCVLMNPWTSSPVAPVALTKHADQLDAAAEARPKTAQ